MRILAVLALLTVVSCGGSKHPAAEPDTRQVVNPGDGVPGEEDNDTCCCQVAHDPARYGWIATAACIDGSGRTVTDTERCGR